MKFAFLIGGELRGVKKTVKNLYKYVIDYYNADVFILCQKNFDDDEERLALFDRNVVYSKLYDKPDPQKYFNDNIFNIEDPDGWRWNKYSNLQIYINMNEYAKVLETYKNNYDYFIIFRPDIEILFPFPSKSFFETIPNDIYIFDPEYCRFWGGLGLPNFVHKNYIIDYTTSYYDIITKDNFDVSIFEENNIPFHTQEFLLTLALKEKNIFMKSIRNINYYYTAETLDDHTTKNPIIKNKKYNVLCKYEEQVDESFQNLESWNNNYTWKYNNEEIFLAN